MLGTDGSVVFRVWVGAVAGRWLAGLRWGLDLGRKRVGRAEQCGISCDLPAQEDHDGPHRGVNIVGASCAESVAAMDSCGV